jgi:hypothetical protein
MTGLTRIDKYLINTLQILHMSHVLGGVTIFRLLGLGFGLGKGLG